MALHAGKSIRWVADQLGHAKPELTLRVYGHAIRSQEEDLSFADFEATKDGTRRPYTDPPLEVASQDAGPEFRSDRRLSRNLEHETGLEPATTTLATWSSTN